MVRGARRNAPKRSSPRGRDGERAWRDRRADSRMPHRRARRPCRMRPVASATARRQPHRNGRTETASQGRRGPRGRRAATAARPRQALGQNTRANTCGPERRARTDVARTEAAKLSAAGTPLGALTIGQSTLDTHPQASRTTASPHDGMAAPQGAAARERSTAVCPASVPGTFDIPRPRRPANCGVPTGSVRRSSAAPTCFG